MDRTCLRNFFVSLMLAASAVNAAAATTNMPAPCPADAAHAAPFVIGSGDVLKISVWNDKNLETTAVVRPDGMISFPLLSDIRAAGVTPVQLQDLIAARLKRYVADPKVSVVVQQIHSYVVSVLGQVQHPGRFELKSGDVTVLDILAQAGGFTQFASRSDIGVLRAGPNGTTRIPFHYHKAVSHRPGAADFCLKSGDIVIVP